MKKMLRQIGANNWFRISAAVLGMYALIGFLLLPFLIEHYAPKYVHATLQRQLSIGKLSINPFLLTVEVNDFALQEADQQPIAGFRQLLIDFEVSSLFNWAWTFADVRLVGLDLNIDKRPDGRLNLVELIKSFPSGEAAKDETAGIVRLLVSNVALEEGVITYSDHAVKTPVTATFKPLNINLLNVTTLPDRNSRYTLSAELQNGGTLKLQGDATLQPLATAGSLEILGFKAATAWSFYQDELRIAEPQGSFDLRLGYRYAAAVDKTSLELHDMHLQGTGLDFRQKNAQQPLLALNALSIEAAEFDLGKRELWLPNIVLRDGRVGVALAADGALNWQALVVDSGAEVPQQKTASTTPDVPWHINLAATKLDNIAVQFNDHTRATPLSLDVGSVAAAFNVDIGIVTAATTVTANVVNMDLSKLVLKPIGDEKPLATLAAVNLTDGKIDTSKRAIRVSKIHLGEGETRIERDQSGVTRLFAALESATDQDADKQKIEQAKTGSPAWRYALDTLVLDKFRIAYADQSLKPALVYDLEQITATLKNINSDIKAPVTFTAAVQAAQGGALSADGSFMLDGASAKANLKMERAALLPLRSLLARQAALDLKAGAASADMTLEYAAENSVLNMNGVASISDLLIDESISGDRFLEWKTLTAEGIVYACAAESQQLNIKEARLLEPGAKILIYKDRSTNVSKVFEQGSGDVATVKKSVDKQSGGKALPITIARVRVDKGVVDYSDQSLVLPFATQIHDFHGAVNGISSDPDSRARVSFNGRVDKYGQAKVSGALSPFAPKRFMDIRTQFINIDMPPFSPYSATFAGRKISTGKLSLDLEYKITDSALAGDNKIVLDKFTLGESVDSPDALDLPLDLAVALLTDSQGRIDIAVPVQGDMNSPSFALGGVIGQAVTRMLTKIITAPFSALGNLLGGGATQANVIAFEPGSEQLLPPQQEKLLGVGKALKERPQLSLSIAGRYAPQLDGQALRTAHVRRALAEELGVKFETSDALGPVAFDYAQTQRALEKMLEARAGDRAIDVFQADVEKQAGKAVERVNPVLAMMGKASPDQAFYAALFERLVELQPLPEAELVTLAQQRANAVMQALIDDAGVAAQRVSVGKVDIAQPVSGETVDTLLSLGVQKAEK